MQIFIRKFSILDYIIIIYKRNGENIMFREERLFLRNYVQSLQRDYFPNANHT